MRHRRDSLNVRRRQSEASKLGSVLLKLTISETGVNLPLRRDKLGYIRNPLGRQAGIGPRDLSRSVPTAQEVGTSAKRV